MSEKISADTLKNLDQSAQTGDKAISLQQVRNRSGIFVFQVSPEQQLRRFIVLGSAANTYYVGRRDLNRANAKEVEALIASDGQLVVRVCRELSTQGRVAKEDNLLLCLAMAARLGNDATRKAAYAAIGPICRTFTALTKFVEFYDTILPNTTGWGRGMRTAIQNWYAGEHRDARSLAYQATKYPNRNGYSHRDLLLLGHVKPENDTRNLVFKYAAKGMEAVKGDENLTKLLTTTEAGALIEAVDRLKAMRDGKEAAAHILKHGLVHEHVPTEIKNEPAVWEALLQNMPLHAMIRNLGTLSRLGLLAQNSDGTKKVLEELGNVEQVQRARIHPFNVMTALGTYRLGRGMRSEWPVNQQIVGGLQKLFVDSFKTVEPSGARMLLALDVSPSMSQNAVWSGARDQNGGMEGSPITAREAAAVMAMATVRAEKMCVLTAFAAGLSPIDLGPQSSFEEFMKYAKQFEGTDFKWSHTDISLPFQYATTNKLDVDCFVVYTDNEVNRVRADQVLVALDKYRQSSGIPAKLVVVAFSADKFTVADPEDAGSLDMPGMDSGGPAVISNFAAGRI